MKVTEASFHKTVADLLDWVLLPPALWTTFPAGWGKLGKATAGRLHGSGLKAGFPDILIFFNGRCTGLELKVPGGKISEKQRGMHLLLAQAGVRVYVCYDTDEVIAALRQASLPVRNLEVAA